MLMKIFNVLVLFSVLLLFSCTQEANYKDLKKHGGIWYGTDGKPYTGYCIRKDENGVLILEAEFKNGLKNGIFRRYHRNGKLIFNTEYRNGVSTGISQQYFSDGRIKSVRLLHDSTFIYAGWGLGDVLRIVREETPDSLADGRTVVYSETGTLQSLFQFSHGVRNGYFMTWHENGKLEMYGKYNSGKSDGLWVKLFPSGKLAGFELYRDGDRTGTWKYFHENGKIKTLYMFSGNRVIRQAGWNENGVKTDDLVREL